MKKREWTKRLLSAIAIFAMSLAMLAGCDSYNVYEAYSLSDNDMPEVNETYSDDGVSDEEINESTLRTEVNTEDTVIAEESVYTSEKQAVSEDELVIDEFGEYNTKYEVALYIHTYGRLPSNYITKKEAQALGWESSKGNLWEVSDGKSIGGDRFGNYEGLLPEADGRKYYECDINYKGGYRGSDRIIYSNDGLVFYTEDHYETFEQLY